MPNTPINRTNRNAESQNIYQNNFDESDFSSNLEEGFDSSDLEFSDDLQRLNHLGQAGQSSSSGLDDNELLRTIDDFSGEEDIFMLDDSGPAMDSSSLKKEIQNFLSEIKSSKLPESEKKKLIDSVSKASSALNLKNEIQAQQLLDEAKQAFESVKELPKGVFALAESLKISITELLDKADAAGFDLRKLPEKPNQALLDFISDLSEFGPDIDGYRTKNEARNTNIKALKTSLESQTSNWYSNSEAPPSLADAKKSVAYFKGEDSEFAEMKSIVSKIKGKLSTALSALGYKIDEGASTQSLDVNELSVAGTKFDFFNFNEASLKLSTTHFTIRSKSEDFAAMPQNRNMTGQAALSDTPGISYERAYGRPDPQGIRVTNNAFHRLINDLEGYPKSSNGDGTVY